LLRTLRAMRLVRSFQFIMPLRLMLLSVVSCLVPMMWAVLLLVLVVGIFALFLEDSALAHLREMKRNQTALDSKDPLVTGLREDWNGMLQAVRSLMYSVSGGADWGDLSEPFWTIPPFCGLAYLVFVMLTIFGLLNVLIGIFVQEAEKMKWDKDMVLEAFVHKRNGLTKEISDLFDDIDSGKTGWISLEEMSNALEKDSIAARFERLEVQFSKVELLFHVLDGNGDTTISKDEFTEGLSKLRGRAHATDAAGVLMQEQKMNKKLEVLGTHICQRIDSLQDGILQEKRASPGLQDWSA